MAKFVELLDPQTNAVAPLRIYDGNWPKGLTGGLAYFYSEENSRNGYFP